MDHYTPRAGAYIYQYPPLDGPIAYDAYAPTAEEYAADHAQSLSTPLELHAPIPVSGQPMPVMSYFPDASDNCFPAANSASPNAALCQPPQSPMSGQPMSTIGYSPTQDTLEHYFPEAAELSTVLSNLQLESSGSPSLALCQEQHSPGIASEYSEYCKTMGPLQPTFPTPSELLAELTAKGLSVPGDEISSDARSESASKARRRAMAKRVGFIPTDPDTISSHDKKRHYLESLEQYIVYLHEQFDLLRHEHPPLQHIAEYKGLSSRSIRTILVHMEHTTRDLNIRTVAEEERFVQLRDELLRRENSSAQGPPVFRHK